MEGRKGVKGINLTSWGVVLAVVFSCFPLVAAQQDQNVSGYGYRLDVLLPRWDARATPVTISRQPYQARRITTSPADDIHPSWSPDGRVIAFVSNRIGAHDGYDLFAIAPDGTNEQLLAQFTVTDPWGGRFGAPNWLGRTGDLLLMDYKYFHEIMRLRLSHALKENALPVLRKVWDGDSPYLTRLLFVPGGQGAHPTVSAEGTSIAWAALVDNWAYVPPERQRWQVHLLVGSHLDDFLGNTDTAGTIVFQTEPGGFIETGHRGIAFSPDGQQIAICACITGWTKGKRKDLYIVHLTTGNVQRLTYTGDDGQDISSVAWSSSGVIAFSKRLNDNSAYDLYVIRPDGTGLTRLTDTPWNELDPSWSPDGSQIAFAADKENNYDIYLMNVSDRRIVWDILEPVGQVVQFPIFRLRAAVPDLPTGTKLQYRIEISRDPQFGREVVVFEQGGQSTPGWVTDEDEGASKIVGFVPSYIFEEDTTYHWRARVRATGQSWSEPSPVKQFRVVPGVTVMVADRIQVGQQGELVFIDVNNPNDVETEYLLSLDVAAPEGFRGRAVLVGPVGSQSRVIVETDQPFGTSGTTLQAVLTLPKGVQRYALAAAFEPVTPSVRVAPVVTFGLKVLASTILSYSVQRLCKSISDGQFSLVLSKEEFNVLENAMRDVAKKVILAPAEPDPKTNSWSTSLLNKLVDEIGSYLYNRGHTELARKMWSSTPVLLKKLNLAVDIADIVYSCYKGWTSARMTRSSQLVNGTTNVNYKGADHVRPGTRVLNQLQFTKPPRTRQDGGMTKQIVFQSEPLSQHLDLSSVQFTGVGFGTHQLLLPDGTRELTLDVDLRPEKNILVQIRGRVNEASRVVAVSFRSINPETGQISEEGFFPVAEKGFVGIAALVRADAPSGSEIRFKANVSFDEEVTITTDEVIVTVDSAAPSSRVLPMPLVHTRGKFDVTLDASDDSSGIDMVELWSSEERIDSASGKPFQRYRVVAGGGEPKVTFEGKFGYRYRFYTRAVDVAGNVEPEPERPDTETIVGEPPTLPTGLRMVSVPVHSEVPDPKLVFPLDANSWARWNPLANNGRGGYVMYGDDPSGYTAFGEPQKVPGCGYWARFAESAQPKVYGALPDDAQPFAISLKKGWNQFGNPWLVDLTWKVSTLQVRVNGQTKAMKDADSIVEPYAWRWDGNSYRFLYDKSLLPGVDDRLPAWEGAWIYAYQDCELILPPPDRAQSARSRQQPAERKGWSITLKARAGEATGEVMLGVTSGTRPLAIGLPPDPPMTDGEPLRVMATKDGVPLAVDVRAEGRANKPWEIEVHVPAGEHDTATLWWQDVHRAPRGVNPVLVDLQTGERKFLRTTSAHTFAVSRQGGVYKFRVELLPEGQLLRISQVRVSGGRSQGSYTVSFAVNAGAQVEVNVLSAGKVVRRLASTVTRSAGVQQVTWDGRDSNGVALPAGAYLVEIKAVSTDGQVVRATTPVVLTR